MLVRGLLAQMYLEHLWAEGGPTPQALQLKNDGFPVGEMTRVEAALLRAAFDFWDGSGHAPLDELLLVLDSPTLDALVDAIPRVRALRGGYG